MNVDKAKRNIRKVYDGMQTNSAYGYVASLTKMKEWEEILDDALAFLEGERVGKLYRISPDLKDKLVKCFTTIEGMADELTTGNVAHKKSAIKGFAGSAKEYLIKHT